MKEEPATDGELRAAFNYTYLLRGSYCRLFARCQEHNSEQGARLVLEELALHWEKRESDFALERPFRQSCGRDKTMTCIQVESSRQRLET